MGTGAGILLAVAALVAMEGVAYAGHRWVMHGPLWVLHRSHHAPRTGWFERNDWFGVMGAAVSMLLFAMGVSLGMGDGWTWAAVGITGYGAIYFGFHDIIVHRRLPFAFVPRSAYMKRIVQAHRLHHAVVSKEGAVSFGFVYAPPVAELKRQLRAKLRSGEGVARSAERRREQP